MILEYRGYRPTIAASAWIAPNAVVAGDVTIGDNCAIGFGAVLSAESGPITIGANVVVMDNAVLRAVKAAPLTIGNDVLIGPHASLSGCSIADQVFVATGASVFNLAVLKARAEVRINAVVHIKTVLDEDAVVPIGWVAVGNPAKILPPDQHEAIWAIQKELDFPATVFGAARPAEGQSLLRDVMPRYARALVRWHGETRELE
jgi:carbonic anhydrase/acetyltransferase-like protein (isoleucine patch superfamily)